MATTAIRARASRFLFHSLRNPKLTSSSSSPNPTRLRFSSLPDLVGDVARVLSDHRSAHHDLELSLKPFSSKLSPDLVEQVLKRCRNLGFPAHRFFLWAESNPGFEPTPQSFHILVDVLGHSKQFAILWDFLSELRGSGRFEICPEIFWVIFRLYSRAHLPDDAIRAFRRMSEFGLKPTVDDLDKLLFELGKRKHMRQAQEFFDGVKVDFDLGPKSYTILIRGWGDLGEIDNARKVFDEMPQRGLSLDVHAYNGFLEALCKSGNGDEAYELFLKMKSSGVAPDACTYSVFIRAYCRSNNVSSVFNALDTMKRYNLFPNAFTYNGIIKVLLKNEKIDEAYELLDEMIENGVNPDSWSYNAILAYHCDHSEVNRALSLISKMDSNSCKRDRHTYNMALKLLVRLGMFDKANEVWESMEERNFHPSVSTYSAMIHSLIKKKDQLGEACRYFEMMIDNGIPAYATTVELMRNSLLGSRFHDHVHVLAGKMEQSTSRVIQEMAPAMRGRRVLGGLKGDESDSDCE